MNLARLLLERIDAELPNLRDLTELHASAPRAPGKWSPKEELGHLIDSASNNHQRFVRAGLGPEAEYRGPSYAQHEWVGIHGYRDLPWPALVAFWHEYNMLLARVVERIPPERLQVPCYIADYPPMSLATLIEDYVKHMQHHLDQLLVREVVTPY